MKKTMAYISITVFILSITACGLFTKTGPAEGMEIYVTTGLEAGSRGARGAVPESVEIAFTKIWFPTAETFTALKAANPNHDAGQIFVNVTTDFSGLSFYKALTSTADNPYVFDSAVSEPFTPADLPPYGGVYHGVLLETVYFQMNLPTYAIRWYQKDSGSYLAQDVLVNDGNGWKFAYLKRTTTFDYENSYSGEPTYDKVQNPSVTGISLVTQNNRLSEGQYFENWYMNNTGTMNSDYIWRALGEYTYPGQTYTLRYYYENLHEPPGGDFTDLTLDQYFRITKDVPNTAGPTFEHIGESLATGYWNENGGLLIKAELIAGYDSDAYDNPKVIETFAEEENEAKMYKIEISFKTDDPDAVGCGLGIDSLPDSLDADSTWTEIVSHAAEENFVSLSPITGGKGIAFGWLDFNDVWQGEFAAEAGQ